MRKTIFGILIALIIIISAPVKEGTLSSGHMEIHSDEQLVISFLGDSITAGRKTNIYYTNLLGSMLGADVIHNYGITKTEISTSGTAKYPMSKRYNQIALDSDFIFVFGGTNDWWHNAVLGTPETGDSSSFYGSLAFMMDGLNIRYPNARIIFLTPLKRIRDGAATMANENGNTLEEFADAILREGRTHHIQVIDLYHSPPCDFSSDTSFSLYWHDGLHPNEYGNLILAQYIYGQL